MKYLPPVLTGIFCTVSLYAANAARISIGNIWLPLLLSAALGAFFTLFFSLNKHTEKGAGVIASFWTLAFLLWNVITPAVSVVFLLISLFIGVKFNNATARKVLLVVMTLAIVVSSISAVFTINGPVVATATPIVAGTDRPNIYFIVPDRMPSIDAMVESGIDPSAFKWELIPKGFYVKDNQLSHDQYTAENPPKVETSRTMRFFASVLNGGKEISLTIPYRECRQLIQVPAIANELHELGYTFWNVGSWFTETSNITNADYNLKFQNQNLYEHIFTGEFNQAFWDRTIIRGLNIKVLLPQREIAEADALRHVWQALNVIQISKAPGQHFVMAHILLPHEPFVWDADGKINYNTGDPVKEYTAQIQFACGYLLSLVDGIQSNDPGAIIIIQSDEGMAYRKPVELNYDLSPVQWNGVLSAWKIKPFNQTELDALKHTEILKYVLDVVK